MTLIEILAKMKADANYDPTEDLNKLTATAVNEATTRLSEKNEELISKLKAAKATADTIPEGFTVEEWTRLTELAKTVDLSKLKSDEAVESLRKQLTEAHTKELTARDDKESGLVKSLEKEMLDNSASAAITAAGGNSDLLLPHVRQQMKMVQKDDGTYAVAIMGEDGKQRYSMTKGGEYMLTEELVGEFKSKDAYKPAFAADNGGGGGGGGGGKDVANNPWMKGSKDFSLTEQARIMNTDPASGKVLQQAAKDAPPLKAPETPVMAPQPGPLFAAGVQSAQT